VERLDLGGEVLPEHVSEGTAGMLLAREPVHCCERLVDPDVAEARVHERQSDRSCGENRVDDGEGLLCFTSRALRLAEQAGVVDRDRGAAR
jgi:hypothetical protein